MNLKKISEKKQIELLLTQNFKKAIFETIRPFLTFKQIKECIINPLLIWNSSIEISAELFEKLGPIIGDIIRKYQTAANKSEQKAKAAQKKLRETLIRLQEEKNFAQTLLGIYAHENRSDLTILIGQTDILIQRMNSSKKNLDKLKIDNEPLSDLILAMAFAQYIHVKDYTLTELFFESFPNISIRTEEKILKASTIFKAAIFCEINLKPNPYLEDIKKLHLISKNAHLQLENALLYPQIIHGTIKPSNKPINLKKTIQDIVNDQKALLEYSQKSYVTISLDWQAEEQVISDPILLKNIIGNLLGNAAKFTDRGKIIVQVRQLSKKNNYQQIQISVQDNGPGIPDNEQKIIFEKFSQASTTRNKATKGAGLGLNIAYNVTKILGGTITVNSTLGKGATFILHLNMQLAAKNKTTTNDLTRKIIHPPVKKLILLVEDNPDIQSIHQTYIHQIGYEVKSVNSGEEAIKALNTTKTPFDAIVMDINLPGINGFEATKQINQLGFNTPVIALSAGKQTDSIEAKKSGMVDFAFKPLTAQALSELLYNNLFSPASKQSKSYGRTTTFPIENAQYYNFQAALSNLSGIYSKKTLDQMALSFLKEGNAYKNLFKEMPDDIEQLRKHIKINSHGIKGSSLNYGLEKITNLAYEIEQMADSANIKEILQKLEELKNLFKTTFAIIQNKIS